MEELGGKFLPVDINDKEQCRQALEEYRKACPIDGLCTFAEISVPLAALLARSLKLPGPPPEATEKARSKALTRRAMRHHGLPGPAMRCVRRRKDLRRAAEVVGFPAVLKPESGAASVGVKKVSNFEELEVAFQEWSQEQKAWVVRNGNLVRRDGEDGGEQLNGRLVLEAYLDGEEADVDVIMSEGTWVYAAVSDNGPTLEPYFNETWAVSPSLLPLHKQLELRDMTVQSVQALGFSDGIFHVELKYTSQGARLVEVNARMGGGPVWATNLRIWGVDLVGEPLLCRWPLLQAPCA